LFPDEIMVVTVRQCHFRCAVGLDDANDTVLTASSPSSNRITDLGV
jgi:hypothetical protein